MSKIKKLLILLGVLLLILIFIKQIITIKKERKAQQDEHNYEGHDYQTIDEHLIKVYFEEYKEIKACLQQYINILNIDSYAYYDLNENGEYIKNVSENEIKENIISLLSKEYISKNGITTVNLYNYIDVYKENKMILPIKIEKRNEQYIQDVVKYKVTALLLNMKDISNFNKIYSVVTLDSKNNTFAIEPIKTDIELKQYGIKENLNYIEKNDNNEYKTQEVTEEEKAKDYFEQYKYILQSDYELAYEYLEEEYSKARFKDLNDFKNYVDNIKERIQKMRLTQYELNYDNENYNQYICANQFGDIFIFNETDTLVYSTVLDQYTIELPQFIEKYDSSNTQEKVILNIEKIKQALNFKDYEYIYNKLNNTFKNNNYETLEQFETYLKEILPEFIKINYKDFSNEGETYIYSLEIIDLMEETNQTANMQIIMKLKENRDFEFSFNIREN